MNAKVTGNYWTFRMGEVESNVINSLMRTLKDSFREYYYYDVWEAPMYEGAEDENYLRYEAPSKLYGILLALQAVGCRLNYNYARLPHSHNGNFRKAWEEFVNDNIHFSC